MALSALQEAFVNEFVKCRKGAEAARRAGYSVNTARSQASRLLTNVNILAEIQRRTAENAMEADEVLSRLAEQARGTIEDYISFNHAPYPTFTLDLDKARERGVLHLIKKLKYNAEGYPEVELYDAQAALVHIGKHHGLFADKVEHSGKIEVKNVIDLSDEELSHIAATRGSGTTET